MFLNPQAAYKAGYALAEPFLDESPLRLLRHVTETGGGTVYTIPTGSVELEVLIESRAGNHGALLGALLEDVKAVAIETGSIQ